jgi:perosamine synthetase
LQHDLAGLELSPSFEPYAESIFWVYGLILKDDVP